jgi:hypothetical protein
MVLRTSGSFVPATSLSHRRDEAAVDRGRSFYASHQDTWLYPPIFKHAHIPAENINELVALPGLVGDVGICSIDVDGNDCWVWKALTAITPRVIIVETHVELGMRNIPVPYDPDYRYPPLKHPQYFGAASPAMV